jgi:hypothetical protein
MNKILEISKNTVQRFMTNKYILSFKKEHFYSKERIPPENIEKRYN